MVERISRLQSRPKMRVCDYAGTQRLKTLLLALKQATRHSASKDWTLGFSDDDDTWRGHHPVPSSILERHTWPKYKEGQGPSRWFVLVETDRVGLNQDNQNA